MIRLLRWAALLTSFTSAVAFAACKADLTEECFGVGCVDPTLESVPGEGGATSSSSVGPGGAGGAGGAGGGAPFDCTLDPSCVTDMPGPADGILPCDVEQVLVDKCQRCHQNPPLMNAPFPLVTYGDTQALYFTQVRFAAMKSAVASTFMPLTPPDLTPAERETMLTWLCACAPSAPPGTVCQ